MHSTGVWSLNHDITTSLRLCNTPIYQKSTPDLQRCNSVRVDTFTHPQHIKVLKHLIYIYDTDVRCTPQWFEASTMPLQHHSGLVLPQFPKKSTHDCGIHSTGL